MAKVMHFEIPATDPAQAKTFYANVFGWTFQQLGEESYWLAKTGKEEEPGIDGAIMKRRDPNQPITNNIQVQDIDRCIQVIKQNGGTIVVDKMDIPGNRKLAFFKDPDGNILGIIQ